MHRRIESSTVPVQVNAITDNEMCGRDGAAAQALKPLLQHRKTPQLHLNGLVVQVFVVKDLMEIEMLLLCAYYSTFRRGDRIAGSV